MALLQANKLGVVFPLRAAKRRKLRAGAAEDRFIVNKAGKATGLRALADIDFTLRDGDRLAIVGRNGSGKSTLLRVLGGVLPPDAGQVYVDGEVRAIFNLSVGVQAASTGRENILLNGLLAGRPREVIDAQMDEIMDFADLGRFIDMPYESYSAGMKMRLLFAAATTFKPDILLMDEWLSAGDAAFKAKAQERMQDLASEAGVLVLASHQASVLKAACTLGLWIDEGRTRMFGPIEEVLDAYTEFSSAERKRAASVAAQNR